MLNYSVLIEKKIIPFFSSYILQNLIFSKDIRGIVEKLVLHLIILLGIINIPCSKFNFFYNYCNKNYCKHKI